MKLEDGSTFHPCDKPDGALTGHAWPSALGARVLNGDIRDIFQQGRQFFLRNVSGIDGAVTWYQLVVRTTKLAPRQVDLVSRVPPRGNAAEVLTMHRRD